MLSKTSKSITSKFGSLNCDRHLKQKDFEIQTQFPNMQQNKKNRVEFGPVQRTKKLTRLSEKNFFVSLLKFFDPRQDFENFFHQGKSSF